MTRQPELFARIRHTASWVSRSQITQPPPWIQKIVAEAFSGTYRRAPISPPVVAIVKSSTVAICGPAPINSVIILVAARASSGVSSYSGGAPDASTPATNAFACG